MNIIEDRQRKKVDERRKVEDKEKRQKRKQKVDDDK